MNGVRVILVACAIAACGMDSLAQNPFATSVLSVDPAPSQWVNDELYNDLVRMLGNPFGDTPQSPNSDSLFSLGGFGGCVTLAFDHTVMDDPANPFGLDAIVFGNALWVDGNPNRKWGECGVIEISRDTNTNGVADDPWYLIPGSHIGQSPSQYEVHTWDDDLGDNTWPPLWPPADETWIPPGRVGLWTSAGYRLPAGIFETIIMENPNGLDAEVEGVYGYADFSPTQGLPDGQTVETFYTRPDNPLAVGLTEGCGGGDAFDIAWAIDPTTWQPADLAGFDFVRITTGVDRVVMSPPFGELSTEIDAVADVAEGQFGDSENDDDIDWDDFALGVGCLLGPDVAAPTCPCRVMDFDQDADVDLADLAELQVGFSGSSG